MVPFWSKSMTIIAPSASRTLVSIVCTAESCFLRLSGGGESQCDFYLLSVFWSRNHSHECRTHQLSIFLQENCLLPCLYCFKIRPTMSSRVSLCASVNIRSAQFGIQFPHVQFNNKCIIEHTVWEKGIFNYFSNSHTSILQHKTWSFITLPHVAAALEAPSACSFVCTPLQNPLMELYQNLINLWWTHFSWSYVLNQCSVGWNDSVRKGLLIRNW